MNNKKNSAKKLFTPSANAKNIYRTIFSNKRRYFAILAIVALGVAFFAGLRSTSPDMNISLDHYFDEQKAFDIRVIAGYGLTAKDVEELSEIDGVSLVMPSHFRDEFALIGDGSYLVRLHSLSPEQYGAINAPVLTSGKLPENDGECVVYERFLGMSGCEIGDTITLSTGTDSDISGEFTQSKLTITGTVLSPLYLSLTLGASSKGHGNINSYIYVPMESFISKSPLSGETIYTEAYFILSETENVSRFDKEYNEIIERYKPLFEQKIDELTEAKSYVLGINENAGFVSFKQDSERIESISRVFPAIFFLVAALVTLSNMMRIVENDRLGIGVMKALGYGKTAIFKKYLSYALSVSIPGGIIGIAVGYRLFPYLIYHYGYRILYTMEHLLTPINFNVSALSFLVAFACVLIPIIAVSYKEMMLDPASLMRPKSPPPGKRVLLERATFIWDKMNFFAKVTARNIFRYKKRFFMTVVGIAGCTALIVTGLGLFDSIKSIVERQFGELFVYDFQINLDDTVTEDEQRNLELYLGMNNNVSGYVRAAQLKTQVNSENEIFDLTVFTPSDYGMFDNFIRLPDAYSRKELQLDENGAVITQKLAQSLGIKAGDTITIEDSDKNQYVISVVGVAENYVAHFAYMSQEYYRQVFGEYPDYKIMLGTMKALVTKESEENLAEQLLQFPSVSGLSFRSGASEYYNDMIDSLQFVVVVLVIAAALLAFVVLISLTGINIDERARELATLKVLGFYDSETSTYILRENAVLTVIGTAVGLVFGIFLHRYVILTAEVNLVMFGREIAPQSFAIAALLTFLFSWLVTLAMGRSINKVDMMESLKSVE